MSITVVVATDNYAALNRMHLWAQDTIADYLGNSLHVDMDLGFSASYSFGTQSSAAQFVLVWL